MPTGLELPHLIALLAIGGLVMGFMAGLFGIGGGSIVVPVLFELFKLQSVPDDVRMHLSIGTSLAVMVPTTLRSAWAYRKKGSVDRDVLDRFGLPVVAGVLVGTIIASAAPTAFFKGIWVAFASAMAVKMLAGKDSWRLGSDLPKSKLIELYGVFVGIISSLLSIGGGIFISMLLNLYGRPLTKSAGTAAAIGPYVAIPGAVGFVWAGWGNSALPAGCIGYLDPIAAMLTIPTSVIAAPLGVHVAHTISKRKLELALAFFFLVVAFRFAVGILT